jgi:hypothetical protein
MRPRTSKERALDAHSRCDFVLNFLREQLTVGARNLAVQSLESAAQYLESLLDHPFFQPETDKDEVVYQEARNQIAFVRICKKRYSSRYARRLIQQLRLEETVLG